MRIFIGIIILLGVLTTTIETNEIFGQEGSKGDILAKSSLNLMVMDVFLSNCEKFNESDGKHTELAQLCVEFFKDFNSKYLELRAENQNYIEGISNLLEK